ncbi:uncharacterized protein LOC125661060 [Ostrea edulis]|uniref:uncharacterized protein LOC125661060 n=1 Tax=Ostrea edulis TaxID=37623 RepID=UPI0024AF6915|nr:uncharacterized protein LOC125661060 [Ostrea edulis]XP_056004127.1 uncharacterized protein LOC125661060 [Ostrea edulis]
MAHSKFTAPRLGTHNRFLECDINECERNCQFYCESCHQQMCEQCRNEHLKSPEYKNHEVVFYQQRKWLLPVEKCKTHPTKDIDMLCEECKVPLCSKCATQKNHKGHNFSDLEAVFAENMVLYHREISKILKDLLPISQKLQKEIKGDAIHIKRTMDILKTEMKANGESLKRMVDTVVSENIQEMDNTEESLLEKLQNEDTAFNDYISYLHDLVKEFHDKLSSPTLMNLIPDPSEKMQNIQPIPERTTSLTPVLIAGQYCKNDVSELLGKINVHGTKAEKPPERTQSATPVFTAGQYCKQNAAELLRKSNIQRTKAETREIKSKEKPKAPKSKPKKENRRKISDLNQTLPLPYSDTKIRSFNVPLAGTTCHISLDQLGMLWVSDYKGNIVQTDREGNHLQKIKTSGRSGCHTVTCGGNLIFANEKNKVINIMLDNITEFIKTGNWEPISVHSSQINDDILVGMVRNGEGKVTRYNKTGKELQKIQRDSKGQRLFTCPWYITENSNGDVCASDIEKQAVVVVNKSGEYNFSYTGQRFGFLPYGICTDALRHILVCDNDSNTVDILDQDGQFLLVLLTQQQGVYGPRCLCVDNTTLFVGNLKVTVYKYLK